MSERRSFLSWSIFRPVTVTMFFVAFSVAGVIAYKNIPLQMMPDGITWPVLTIIVNYPDANPSDVEKKITRPIEEMAGTIQGVKEIRSRSSSTGSRVRLHFKSTVDLNIMYNQLQDRMERLMVDFPEDVTRYRIRKFNFQDFPIQYVGISLRKKDKNVKPEDALKKLVDYASLFDRTMLMRLEQEDGIANVELHGTYNKKIYIDLIPDKVAAYHVNVFQLVQRLRNANLNLTQGKIVDNRGTFLVRSLGKFTSLKDIREFPVKEGIQLQDVAEIFLASSLKSFRVRINALPAMFCEIYKESGANTVKVCTKVKEIMESYKKDSRFENFEFTFLYSEGDDIEDALLNLQQTLLWGAFFAVLVLFFFLRSVRMTFVITFSIPVSLMMAIVVVHAYGGTLNLISLMGFTLGVGMLLDNAVVVVENIYRHLEKGLSLMDAAVKGVNEVGLAILLATSTTLVVFIPSMVMTEGTERVMMVEMGGAVCYSLVASLIVALVFIPPAVYAMEKRKKTVKRFMIFEKIIAKSNDIYYKILSWVMARRFETICFILIPLTYSTWIIKGKIGVTNQQNGSQRQMQVRFSFTDSQDVSKNSALLLKVEQAIFAKKKELEIINMLSFCRDNSGRIRLWFSEGDDIKRSTDEIAQDVQKLIPRLPGVSIRGNWQQSSSGGGNQEEGDVPIVLRGENPETLREIGKEVEKLLQGIPELLDVGVEESEQAEEIIVHLDREQTQRYDISPQRTATTISYALRGFTVSQFQVDDHEIPIEIQFEQSLVANADMLNDITVYNRNEEEVTLGTLGEILYEKGFATIRRRNRKTTFTINATANKSNLTALGVKIDKALQTLKLPRGYTINKEGRFVELEENQNTFLLTMGLAIVLVFLLMGFLFESFILPFSIILSIPFAFIGVFWILYLTSTPISMMVYLGNIILAGVVVNNGIVLVDYINRLRGEGIERTEAILQASFARFRPIMMTSLTTLFGLLPMAIGTADFAGTPYYPLGRTVIGGLTMSTLLTLLIVPIFYVFFDDLRNTFLRLVTGVFIKGK
ncbi:efflux RND transporter permease subunit [Candidatus Uabimicrobium sp. HlEnr_7]|uniref:efflux RND transporter permease subunit n=1 Tax=Candidatus Uabimicrobium helgolandensis TaxID=3095367 RepID=UPI0035584021